jgi:site-specific recombinase XerD
VREALAQVESGVPLTRDGAGPTVEEWLWYWHDNIQARRVREATLSAQEVVIRRHLVPHLGRVRLRELTPEHVESLLARLEGPGFNSTSVLKVHRCLSRSLVVAMQRGLIHRNVCTLIDAPRLSRRRSSRSPARRRAACSSRPDSDGTLRAGSSPWPPAFAKARHSPSPGRTSTWRPGPWPSDSRWRVPATVTAAGDLRRAASARSTALRGQATVPSSPTSSLGPGKRVVMLPQPLVEALRLHRTAQLQERLAAGSMWWTEPAAPKGRSWDLVFRQPDGKPVGHKRDHADWKSLLVDAGVRDARLHDARHTAASLLLLLKVPARVVMDILGHSSYQLTMNTYSHVAPELNSEAAQLMAGALWDSPSTEADGGVRRRSP